MLDAGCWMQVAGTLGLRQAGIWLDRLTRWSTFVVQAYLAGVGCTVGTPV
jgi:hypothetical protein